MKHDRFIELLNLYLDGEISQAESADLEREITQNPERRKIYRQYCQMQRACNMLSEKFRDAAETPQAAGDNVVAFPVRPAKTWARTFSMVASGAVAACFVFILARSGFSPNTSTTPSITSPSVALQNAPAIREQQIPVTALSPMQAHAFASPVLVNSTNPGDFVTAVAVPVSAQPGRNRSLFLAVPPLPNHQYQQPLMLQNRFPGDARPELQINPVLENAIQFPR